MCTCSLYFNLFSSLLLLFFRLFIFIVRMLCFSLLFILPELVVCFRRCSLLLFCVLHDLSCLLFLVLSLELVFSVLHFVLCSCCCYLFLFFVFVIVFVLCSLSVILSRRLLIASFWPPRKTSPIPPINQSSLAIIVHCFCSLFLNLFFVFAVVL